jgi:hypothetical protein
MAPRARFAVALLAGAALAALGNVLSGCAATHTESPGVPIDQRPSPHPQAGTPQSPAPTATGTDSTPVPVPHEATPSGEESLRSLAVRDTLAASQALARCTGRNLTPEQETTYDATLKLIADARDALVRGDVTRARSVARNARQLVSSLECP